MSLPIELEDLQNIFKDQRMHIGIGTITKIILADDRSFLRVYVSVLPEGREITAKMTWEHVGPSSGIFVFPNVNDVVLIGMPNGDINLAYVLKRLTSKVNKIPLQAVSGDTAIVAKSGKKAWISSNSRINLSKTATTPTEPVVLGNTLASFFGAIFDAILDAPQIGQSPVGPVFLDPGVRTALVAAKAQYLQTSATNILSQLVFTERGN
jgi:hypothetical protein